jgi:hypothetical protein
MTANPAALTPDATSTDPTPARVAATEETDHG